ncbi:hypothetical protein QBC45DRAFT_93993 [Copromyces sp. CBS 386.78]|nr:hypothetical protein QBC45DRAFT_93993 [Copromyces sp. CBS 386.78]
MSDLISQSARLTGAPHAVLPLLSHLLFGTLLCLALAVRTKAFVQLLTITAVPRCTADVLVTAWYQYHDPDLKMWWYPV